MRGKTIRKSADDDVFNDPASSTYDYLRGYKDEEKRGGSCSSISTSVMSTEDLHTDDMAEKQLHKITKKIESTKDDLVVLQNVKDEIVSVYLKSMDEDGVNDSVGAGDVNNINANKMKVQFEKNNQHTNVSIQLLQKKLEKYQLQVKKIEEHGFHGNKSPLIKLVQNHMRSGASTISDAVTKTLESLNNFIKKEKKNSSEDVNQDGVEGNDDAQEASERGNAHQSMTSDEENLSSDSLPNLLKSTPATDTNGSNTITSQRFVSSPNVDQDFDTLKERLEKLEDENIATRDNMDFYKDGLNKMLASLQNKRAKTEQIQAVLNNLFNQWNDLIELQQNEMHGVKEEMEHILERIACVEYRFSERTAELHESVENCLTRISKQKLQSQELQQQPIDSYVTMDSKILLNKFIGFFINIFIVGICIFSNIGKLLVPFVVNKVRLLTIVAGMVSILMLAQVANIEVTSILGFLFILVNCIYTVFFCW